MTGAKVHNDKECFMFLPFGVIPAIVTPMRQDESIDFEALEGLVDRLIAAGVNGLFCLGTSGEFYALTEQEKVDVSKAVVDAAAGRVPVYAGAGMPCTAGVLRLSRRLAATGIQALSVVTPFYIAPDQRQLLHHYTEIAKGVDLPVILYNIPGRTGLNLCTETVGELARISNVIGIKDSSGRIENTIAYLEVTDRRNFAVLSGSDSLILDALQHGGTGTIASTGNIIPERLVQLYTYWSNGELENARRIQDMLLPICSLLDEGTVPGVIKQMTNLAGIPVGPARLPITGLPDSEVPRMKAILDSVRMNMSR
jgi:4-hydroxy-tetrahydrodipicolinate synthase